MSRIARGSGSKSSIAQVQNATVAGQQEPSLAGLFSSFQVSVPQIDVQVDRERVKTYGIPLTDVFDTLQVYLGSLYANDFNRFGRTYQVNVQAESSFRMQPEQIARLKTRNAKGEMVPLGSVLRVGRTYGPDQVMHYNGYPAAEINGGPSPGHSSGQAQGAIAALLGRTLPNGMTFEWTELAYQDAISGNTMLLIFPLCVLLVYGVLAAQYESWSLPLAVILIVPMTLLSAIAGVWLTGGDNNVFTQISFLVLAGLACKNAILIVEFARQREHEGAPRRDGDPRRVPHPSAAGADDVGGVHHGRRSAGARERAGRRSAAGDGHRRVRRHARRHAVRPVPDTHLLRGRPGRGGAIVAAAIRGGCTRCVRGRGGSLIVRTRPTFPAAGAAARDVRAGRRGVRAAHCPAGHFRPGVGVPALGRGRLLGSVVRRALVASAQMQLRSAAPGSACRAGATSADRTTVRRTPTPPIVGTPTPRPRPSGV